MHGKGRVAEWLYVGGVHRHVTIVKIIERPGYGDVAETVVRRRAATVM